MELKFWFEIALILVLIFISAFFAASEISLIAIRRSRVKEMVDAGVTQAEFIEKLRNDPDKFFAVVQVGKTITDSAASALGGAAAVTIVKPLIASLPFAPIQNTAGTISIIIVVLVISYLFLVLAELVPKALAVRRTEKIALIAGPITWWLYRGLSVFIGFLSWSANVVLRLFGITKEERRESAVSEEEVKILLKEGLQHGVFEPSEHKLIHSVFEFADTVARNAMTPRTEIAAVEINDSPEEILKIANIEQYSRFPVYEENLDNIKGIVHTRDLLTVFENRGLIIVRDIMRLPFFVPDSKKISELLKDMQKRKTHMAIVLDEFGGTAGLITLEDILEEIVGEIQDEYDIEENDIIMKADGSAVVDGSVDADIVCERFGVRRPDGDFESIAGMVINFLGHLPVLEETVNIAGLKITVIEKEGHRVKRLKVEKSSDVTQPDIKQDKEIGG
jgi:putative hemolysin